LSLNAQTMLKGVRIKNYLRKGNKQVIEGTLIKPACKHQSGHGLTSVEQDGKIKGFIDRTKRMSMLEYTDLKEKEKNNIANAYLEHLSSTSKDVQLNTGHDDQMSKVK
jgi:hypothetical protein